MAGPRPGQALCWAVELVRMRVCEDAPCCPSTQCRHLASGCLWCMLVEFHLPRAQCGNQAPVPANKGEEFSCLATTLVSRFQTRRTVNLSPEGGTREEESGQRVPFGGAALVPVSGKCVRMEMALRWSHTPAVTAVGDGQKWPAPREPASLLSLALR